jgi:hypothetical protein
MLMSSAGKPENTAVFVFEGGWRRAGFRATLIVAVPRTRSPTGNEHDAGDHRDGAENNAPIHRLKFA